VQGNVFSRKAMVKKQNEKSKMKTKRKIEDEIVTE
jgi:hypothetical protein